MRFKQWHTPQSTPPDNQGHARLSFTSNELQTGTPEVQIVLLLMELG
jgi:hypothetical protein